jgi:hypothetical protein
VECGLLRVFRATAPFSTPKRGRDCVLYPWLPLTPCSAPHRLSGGTRKLRQSLPGFELAGALDEMSSDQFDLGLWARQSVDELIAERIGFWRTAPSLAAHRGQLAALTPRIPPNSVAHSSHRNMALAFCSAGDSKLLSFRRLSGTFFALSSYAGGGTRTPDTRIMILSRELRLFAAVRPLPR